MLAQTLRPAEVILVDDGSGDETLAGLEALAAAHSSECIRIVALHDNHGAASARNAGWEVATQQFVAFLDADDTWHPRKIELQHGYMAEHPEVTLSGHGYEFISAAGTPQEKFCDLDVQPVSKLALLLSNRLVTPSVMLRRDVPYRFHAGRRHVDDHLLWLQLLCAGSRLVRFSAPLAYVYKAMYGESGLSAEMWKMEKAELENYWILHRDGCIGTPAVIALWVYSLAKFVRRALVVSARRLMHAPG